MRKIAVLCTLYIDSDVIYDLANATLDSICSKYELVLYARVSRLSDKYKNILKRFDSVVENDRNTLSRSWNKGISKALKDGCEYVVVPNLDLRLNKDTIDNLIEFADKDDSVMWSGRCSNTTAHYPDGDFITNGFIVKDNFALFMVNDRLFKEVGRFDEKFEPAYGEDVDMQYRIDLAGKKHTCVDRARFYHYGQVTVRTSPSWVGVNPEQVDEYFTKKWGGIPRQQIFKTPFNK